MLAEQGGLGLSGHVLHILVNIVQKRAGLESEEAYQGLEDIDCFKLLAIEIELLNAGWYNVDLNLVIRGGELAELFALSNMLLQGGEVLL